MVLIEEKKDEELEEDDEGGKVYENHELLSGKSKPKKKAYLLKTSRNRDRPSNTIAT